MRVFLFNNIRIIKSPYELKDLSIEVTLYK